MKETKLSMLLDYLRKNGNQNNDEIATGLGFDKEFVRHNISLLKARKWIVVSGRSPNRVIEVIYEEPENLQDYKRNVYTEMLPILLLDFSEVTSVQDRSLVAKLIFKVMDNL